MSFNFTIAGNSCFCSCSSGKGGDEDCDAYKIIALQNKMVVRKAIVMQEVMESAIGPTCHIGKAIEKYLHRH